MTCRRALAGRDRRHRGRNNSAYPLSDCPDRTTIRQARADREAVCHDGRARRELLAISTRGACSPSFTTFSSRDRLASSFATSTGAASAESAAWSPPVRQSRAATAEMVRGAAARPLLRREPSPALPVATARLRPASAAGLRRVSGHVRQSDTGHCSRPVRGGSGTVRIPVTLSLHFESPISEWHVTVLGDRALGDVDVFRDIYVRLPNDGEHSSLSVLRTSIAATWAHWSQHVTNGPKHLWERSDMATRRSSDAFTTAVMTGRSPEGVSATTRWRCFGCSMTFSGPSESWPSVPNPNYADMCRAGHPVWRRCSSLTYSRYAHSSRLASRAPRSGTLSPYFGIGTLARCELSSSRTTTRLTAAGLRSWRARWPGFFGRATRSSGSRATAIRFRPTSSDR